MPPRQEKSHLLLVNPNGTNEMTTTLWRLYCETPYATLSIVDGSDVPGCPAAIEDHTSSVISAGLMLPVVLKTVALHAQAKADIDGILICCFSDHPLVQVLRENVNIPVMGIFHASLHAVSMLDRKFGIVTTAMAWQPILTTSVRIAGAQDSSAGVISTGLGVLELESRPRDEVLARIEECTTMLIDRGARCIILGCAGMAPLEKLLRDTLPSEIKIIDGVRYGIQFLVALTSV
jgi:Asp/Glu/hydantoin racemase